MFLFIFRRPFVFRGLSPRYGVGLFSDDLCFRGRSPRCGFALFSDDPLFSWAKPTLRGWAIFRRPFVFRGRSPRYGGALIFRRPLFSWVKPTLRYCAHLGDVRGFDYLKFNIGQPFALASCSSSASGLTATGSLTRRSSGRSFLESL